MYKALNASVKINPTFTNDYWQLYSSKGGYKSAVKKLNSALQKAVNAKDSTRFSVSAAMQPVFRELEDFGASDTEPRELFYTVLDQIYGDKS
jgi:hypothetical protein